MLSPLKSFILSLGLWAVMSLSVSAAGFDRPAICAHADVCELSEDFEPIHLSLFTGLGDDVPLGRLPRSKYATSHSQLGKILTVCRHFSSFSRKLALAIIDYRIKIASQTYGRLNAADYYVFTLRRIII